jgi:hypothetical protein
MAAMPAEEPAADPMAAMPAEEPAPAPVAESKADKNDNDPPFDPDPTPSKKVTPGKHGQGHSQAKHLAQQGLKNAIAKAKRAGATLETQLDFGHKAMTLKDAIEEGGMQPNEFGFEDEGLPAMLKYISGFYSKENGNFPLGGMRVKIKVKKAFEDGEFGEANPEDLLKVIKFIDMKDPSGDEQHSVLKLAGVRNEPEPSESSMMPNFEDMVSSLNTEIHELSNPVSESVTYRDEGSLARIIQLSRS